MRIASAVLVGLAALLLLAPAAAVGTAPPPFRAPAPALLPDPWGLSAVPDLADGPVQVHLSQIGDRIIVQWAILGDTRSLPAGRIEYGPTSVYSSQAQGEMAGYVDATPYIGYSSAGVARDLAEAAATLYRAELPAMAPSSTFHYRVVDGSSIASRDFTARTLPGPGSSLRFVAYGDQGTLEDGTMGPPSHRPMEIVNLSLAQDPQLVLIAGDLSYSEEGGLRWWNQWFDIIEPVAAVRPYYAAVGNHDRDLLVGYDHWYKRFSFARDEQNYAFDAGPVHFLVVNSQEACLEGQTTETVQRVNPNCMITTPTNAPLENTEITDFMRADLADARSRGVPWIVVSFHHPPYAHGGYNESNSGSAYMWWMREHWLPILEEYGVDLVINGHDHAYSRTWPMLDNATTTTSGSRYREGDGIVYMISGGGGRPTYTLSGGTPWWMAKSASTHHAAVVDATAAKLKVAVKDHTGAVIDSFEIRKASGGNANNALPLTLALVALTGIVGHLVRARHRRSAQR